MGKEINHYFTTIFDIAVGSRRALYSSGININAGARAACGGRSRRMCHCRRYARTGARASGKTVHKFINLIFFFLLLFIGGNTRARTMGSED